MNTQIGDRLGLSGVFCAVVLSSTDITDILLRLPAYGGMVWIDKIAHHGYNREVEVL